MLVGDRGTAVDAVSEEGVRNRGHHQADSTGPLRHQAPSQRIWMEIKGTNGLYHPIARLVPNPALVVDHSRDRLDRDTGRAGHVMNGHRH